MKLPVISTLSVLILLFLNACATTPTAQAPDSVDNYPLDTKTGIEDVDNVIAAVASSDPQALRSLISYTRAPCTTAEGLGGPPKCRDGESEGTMLEVLPFMGSEGSYIRKSEIGNWQGIDATAIYAVYRVSENAQVDEYSPPGKYAVIFVSTENQPAVSIRIANGGIVRIDYLLDSSPQALQIAIERDASEVILAPHIR